MPFQDKEIRTLTRLGLTSCQARVYLALVRSGISTAKTISDISHVARPDVYRIMPMLQEVGLAEKIVSVPTKFTATPIQDGITHLLDRKREETLELEQESKELLKKFGEYDPKSPIQEEVHQFVLVPKGERLFLKLKEAIENSQSSIDVISPARARAHPKGLSIIREASEEALGKGVKIRWILQNPKDINLYSETVRTFTKKPLFKCRFILESPEVRFGMFDKKEVFIATHPTRRVLESACLWTNNPTCLRIIRHYFEILWITALENLHEEQPITDALI